MAGKWSKWFNHYLGRVRLSSPERGEEHTPLEKDSSHEIPSGGLDLGAARISDADLKEAASPLEGSSTALGGGEWKPGDSVLKDYQVEGELGRGGMGMVYLVSSRRFVEHFAVKRTRFQSDAARASFLVELQTWVDLPEQEHLVAYRFFRTIGDEIAIFSEYLEGGSLQNWIERRRLYEGGQENALERILDIAVQTAWGLHAAHELGLVHQDMKPANVLLSADGVAKVGDFGLARAKARAEESMGDRRGTIMVSCAGMTPAYCSPEQAARKALSRKTDIWSWGLSVLQMFVGECTWQVGEVAAKALDVYLLGMGEDDSLPLMPPGMAEVLRKCFQEDPAKRWATMHEAAEAVTEVYRQCAIREYPRPTPVFPRAADRKLFEHDRRTTTGVKWCDPRSWLVKALRADGRDPAEAHRLCPLRSSDRRAQAVTDLAVFDEARRIYERLISSGREDLETELTELCLSQALLHEHLSDIKAALALHDKVIAFYERMVNREDRKEMESRLASSYMNKAVTLAAWGDNRVAKDLFFHAISILERLASMEGYNQFESDLALCYKNMGNTSSELGEKLAAVSWYDRALAIYESLIESGGREEIENHLASTYADKGLVQSHLGDKQTAIRLYDRAIAIRERLCREGDWELESRLARNYVHKANALSDLGDRGTAAKFHDQAIIIYKWLVEREGHRELESALASAYMDKAVGVSRFGEFHAAAELNRLAIAIWERLAEKEGHDELDSSLATCHLNMAIFTRHLGANHSVVEHCDRSIAIYDRLVYGRHKRNMAGYLGWARVTKAEVLLTLGHRVPAMDELQAGIVLLKEAVQTSHGPTFQEMLSRAMGML